MSNAMPGRTPTEAYHNFTEPNQSALNTISVGRLLLARKHGTINVETQLAVALNGGARSPLKWSGSGQIFIEVAILVSIDPLIFGEHRFQCRQIGYWHRISDGEGREILAYHWTPNVSGSERSFPHLHVGSAVPLFPSELASRFHKFHIPTGVMTVPQLVRFAIQELGVFVRPGLNQESVLAQLNRTIGDT
jgi:hypothetical protein